METSVPVERACDTEEGDGPPPAKRKCSAQPVNAVIYEWCLDRIERNHPLFHVSYIGQVVRPGMTAQAAFEVRTRQHVCDAARKAKELGLHWAIQTFGVDAFTVCIVETNRLPYVEAIAWANEREIALIAQRGGPMRDREPDNSIRQTLNLTAGGRGDPGAVWQSIEIRSETRWRKAQTYLSAYYNEHGNLRVPTAYTSPDGFRLGELVKGTRTCGYYVNGRCDRLAWLEQRGWVVNEFTAKWKDAQSYLQAFYNEHNHLRVPKAYITSDGVKLGYLVSKIRSEGMYVKGHADRLTWLKKRGWVANTHDAMWETAQSYLQAFYNEHKHLRVSQNYKAQDGFKLGKLVQSIRTRGIYVNVNRDRLLWLKERGWVANVYDTMWETAQTYLQAFYNEHKHLIVPSAYIITDDFNLGRLVSSIRNRGSHVRGHPERLMWLKAHGFKMHARNAVQDAQRWAALGA